MSSAYRCIPSERAAAARTSPATFTQYNDYYENDSSVRTYFMYKITDNKYGDDDDDRHHWATIVRQKGMPGRPSCGLSLSRRKKNTRASPAIESGQAFYFVRGEPQSTAGDRSSAISLADDPCCAAAPSTRVAAAGARWGADCALLGPL